MANEGNLVAVDVDDSEFGVAGRDGNFVCTKSICADCVSMRFLFWNPGLPSFGLGVSGLFVGTMRRLKLLTLSRNDNAGDGGGWGRCGNG